MSIKNLWHRSGAFVKTAAISAMVASQTAKAALPKVADPSTAADDGNFIQLFQNYAYDIGLVIGLLLGTLGLVVVVRNVLGVYAKIADGKATWGELGMQAAMGVLLLVFTVFLLTEASGVLDPA